MSAAIGTLAKLGIDTADPVTKRFDFQEGSDIGLDEDFLDGNGLRGTLEHDVTRNVAGNRRVTGSLILQPNAVELALLLQWILGGTPTGTPTVTYPLADSLVTRYVAVDRNATTLFTYDAVAVDRATFRASKGGPMTLTLDVVGKDEAQSGSFPSLTIDTATSQWLFTQCAISINSVTVMAEEVELTIDNMIDKDRFFNTQTLVTSNKLDRRITFRTSLPWGDHYALYNTGASGVAVSLTWTNGGAVLTQSMVKIPFPRKRLAPMGKREQMFPLEGQAMKSASTASLVTTLNPGP